MVAEILYSYCKYAGAGLFSKNKYLICRDTYYNKSIFPNTVHYMFDEQLFNEQQAKAIVTYLNKVNNGKKV